MALLAVMPAGRTRTLQLRQLTFQAAEPINLNLVAPPSVTQSSGSGWSDLPPPDPSPPPPCHCCKIWCE